MFVLFLKIFFRFCFVLFVLIFVVVVGGVIFFFRFFFFGLDPSVLGIEC